MKEIRTNTTIERILTTIGLGMAGAAFSVLGIYTGVLSAGLIPMILGEGAYETEIRSLKTEVKIIGNRNTYIHR